MDLQALIERMKAECDKANLPLSSKGEPLDTVSDLLGQVGEYLMKDIPVDLGAKLTRMLLDAVTADLIERHGILVNPLSVEGELPEPKLVLLDDDRHVVKQETTGAGVYYRGGAETNIVLSHESEAHAFGQKKVEAGAGSTLYADCVDKISAYRARKVYVSNCRMLDMFHVYDSKISNCYAVSRDESHVEVGRGARLDFQNYAGGAHSYPGSIIVAEDLHALLGAQGVEIEREESKELKEAILSRMQTVAYVNENAYVQDMTLADRKAPYLDPALSAFFEAYAADHQLSAADAILSADTKEELAAIVLPYIDKVTEVVPIEEVTRHFRPETLISYNIFDSSYDMPEKLDLRDTPIHLFRNAVGEFKNVSQPIHVHGNAIAVTDGKARVITHDKGTGFVRGESTLETRDASFGILAGNASGIIGPGSQFIVTEDAKVSLGDKASGEAYGHAFVEALGNGAKVFFKENAAGTIGGNSQALVEGDGVSVKMMGESELFTNMPYDAKCLTEKATAVVVKDSAEWDALKEQFHKADARLTATGREKAEPKISWNW